jgi:protocatechuate 3,4-dioxygenase beta subunit
MISRPTTPVLLFLVFPGFALANSGPAIGEEAPPDLDALKPVAMCSEDEPGRKLLFHGRVLDADGRGLSKAAVIAYNTGEDGLYNPRGVGTRTPRIRGAAVSDERGFFSFKTVWPGAYPNASEPAHIHVAAIAPAHGLKYLLILFKGDPKLTPTHLKSEEGEGVVIVDPQRQADGSFVFRQDIKLADD